MSKLIGKINYWAQLLLLPIYWLSFLMPRDKNIWLFGSTFGRRFADNPRYFYLYIKQHEKNIRPIWISRNKEIIALLNKNNYEAYYYKSLKGIYYCLAGKVYIFDNYSKDISFWLSGGAKKINLWHGIPLKKIQADNIFDTVRNPRTKKDKIHSFVRRLSDEKPSHYVLTTSDFLIPIFSSAFRTSHVLTSGYPRNDILLTGKIRNLLTEPEKKNKYKISDFLFKADNPKRKMIYYMPTFRDSETNFFEIVELNAFKVFLKEHNFLFCTKLHPKSKLKKEFEKISGENILVIDADTDPYVFLKMADVLVTDYSSIYFDFLLLDKPIVFFDYDLDEYLSGSREMYFDYDKFTPGEKVQTLDALEKALLNACEPDTAFADKYKKLRKNIADKVFNEKTTISSLRLVRDIKDILKM